VVLFPSQTSSFLIPVAGCGTDYLSNKLYPPGTYVIGVDFALVCLKLPALAIQISGMVMAGRYVTAGQTAYWDGKTERGEVVSSGTYFYQLQAGDYTETCKMVRLK